MATTYFPERYTTPAPSTVEVGGIPVSSSFETVSLSDLFNALLYSEPSDSIFLPPYFSAFGISGQAGIIEVGNSIAANRTFTWTTARSANISPNTVSLIDVTAGNVVIASGLANDGSEAVIYGAVTKTTYTNNRFEVRATDLRSIAFSKRYTVTWKWRRYYGESSSTSLDEAAIKALRVSHLSSTAAWTYPFAAGGYKYIASPYTATLFKDTLTQLPVPMNTVAVVPVTNGYGQTTNYNVYRTYYPITSDISIIAS